MALLDTFVPDNLVAGSTQLVTDTVIVASSAALVRGAVLGKITSGGKLILSATGAGDGSEVANAILAEDCDASGGDVSGVVVYVKGEFNENELTFGTGHDATTVKPQLRDLGIFTKSAVAR